MAALAQSLELLPGISVMWTPSELLCTQFETNFKDVLLPVFKRKFYYPRGEAFCGFPLAQLSLSSIPLLDFAPLKSSCPCWAFNLTPSVWDRGNDSSFPSHFPSAGPGQSIRVHWKCPQPRSPAGHPGIAAGLGPAPSSFTGAKGHGVWGSQAGSSASKTAQMLKLEQIRGTHLFSQQSKFSPILSQI